MSQENNQKQRIDSAIDKLTGFMNKDIDQAKRLTESLIKESEQSKLEKLKKFIGHVASIDPSEIEADENIRQRMDLQSEEFESLLESVTKNGVQQNLIIEFSEDESAKGYKLKCVAGHRRLAAAKMAGQKFVPCLIRTFSSESEKVEIALAENLLREGLHVLDIADGYLRLLDLGWSRENIQKYFDRNQTTVRYYLKISQWPSDAKNLIRDNPSKLTSRLIMRKFACRKYANDAELLSSLNKELFPSEENKPVNKRITLSSKIQGYLETKRFNEETKDIIWRLMLDLRLVKEVPKKD